MIPAMKFSGTYPWIAAPTPIPASTYGHTFPTMSRTASMPYRTRSRHDRRSPAGAPSPPEGIA